MSVYRPICRPVNNLNEDVYIYKYKSIFLNQVESGNTMGGTPSASRAVACISDRCKLRFGDDGIGEARGNPHAGNGKWENELKTKELALSQR